MFKACRGRLKKEKSMKFASISTADEIIKELKENELTNYFGQTYSTVLPKYIGFSDIKELFLSRGFGENESNLILASLVKVGCKFTI